MHSLTITVLGVDMITVEAVVRPNNRGSGAKRLYNWSSDWHGRPKESVGKVRLHSTDNSSFSANCAC
jgi:hypothetical protein